MLKCAILTIGDEICIGQIVNTNASWMASKCVELGYKLIAHSSIEDDKQSILDELNRLSDLADIILITGGLGPTHDDITKPVLCEYFNDKLIIDEKVLVHIKDIFAKRNRPFLERNAGQAEVPSKCTVLFNEIGTAPGMMFLENKKIIVSMPGVPKEMKGLMENHVLPFLKNKITSESAAVQKYKILNTAGIPESFLADLIGEPEEFLMGGSLAFLPNFKGVKLRIGVEGANFEEAEEKIANIETYIREKAGKYIIGENDKTLAQALGELLIRNNFTLAVAESCTGGGLGFELTNAPGSSAFFLGGVITYANESKIRDLGVNPDTINSYGAVSEECAVEMAIGARNRFNSDFAISITGIAGPDGGTDDKPVGTVWIGLATSTSAGANQYFFGPDRIMNRDRAIAQAMIDLFKTFY